MYRLLIAVLLCLEPAAAAPQGKDSDVTYVKIQPVVEDTPLEAAASTRESRIEKLPLTIPGNISTTDKEPDKLKVIEEIPAETTTEKRLDVPEVNSDLSEPKVEDQTSSPDFSERESESDVSENLEESETNQYEQKSDPSFEESNTTDDLSEISPTDDLSVSHSENQSDTVPSETGQSDRRARNFESIETTEAAEDATDKYEDELIEPTIKEAPRTKAPPKFIPKTPKLSYYPKPRVFQSYSSNHLDIVGKRKFRSRCSCQKIWNCPKLQISVPRCPNEYFLCCF